MAVMATAIEPKPREDISTATIYATPEEWQFYKDVSANENRREAAQLVYLARRAVENPGEFRLIRRPETGKPAYQVRTRDANPYLKILANRVDPDGTARVTLSEIVEALIRGLSVH